MRKRGRLGAWCACLALCAVLLGGWVFSGIVRAVPNEQIEQLLMVGGTGLSQMHTAVANQYLHDGDVLQHGWIEGGNLGGVSSAISGDPAVAAKQAVVVWLGEDYTQSRIPGYESWFNNDWLGRDSSSLPASDAEYSGIALGRALAGYDYYVLQECVTPSPSFDSIPVEAVHRKYADGIYASAVAPYQPVENWHYEHQSGDSVPEGAEHVQEIYRTEYYEDEETGEWIPYQVFDHYEWDMHTTDNWTYWIEVQQHKTGYAETWKSQGALVYVASLGPYSKSTDSATMDAQNAPTKTFNETLRSNATGLSFLDLFDEILAHNPYYRDGSDHGAYYDDQTLCWIFHLIWNSVLNDNPNAPSPDPVDQSFYSLSCSLTSYMNNVLSSGADEMHAHHTLIEAATDSVGNAGAFLGYGDEDYDFTPYLTGIASASSSVIDYGSLIGHEGGTNEQYLYARYGYLLKDLGLDAVGTPAVVGFGRWIPGALMIVMYVISTAVPVLFSGIMDLLQLLNPFQFFAHASNIAAQARVQMVTGGGLSGFLGSDFALNGAVLNILDFCGDLYDGFQDIGLFVVIPLSLVFLAAWLLLKKNADPGSRWQKVRSFLTRFAFIAVGIPLLGVMYTSALQVVSGMTVTADCASTQMVAATFLDFQSWAKNLRLDAVDGTVLVSEPATSSDASSLGGVAGAGAYRSLRSTVSAINRASGATDAVPVFSSDILSDEGSFTDAVLNGTDSHNAKAVRQVLGLLRSYVTGSFYMASDWESDAMSAVTKNHSGQIGSLVAGDTKDPNAGTLYELFDQTNETSDWLARASADNKAIFDGTSPYDAWGNFNVFANGKLQADDNSARETDTVTYMSGGSAGVHGAVCPCSSVGLSTLSLYNYLSTDFSSGQMTVYSNSETTSQAVSVGHYAVNLIGSGVFHVLYWLNCFALMAVVAVIGACYAIGMMVQTVQRTIKVLAAVPGSLLGVLRSMVQVLVTVFLMIAEVVGTILCYNLISQLLMLFVTVLEAPLSNAVANATVVIGGQLAALGSDMLSIDALGCLGTAFGLSFTSVICLGLAVCLARRAKGFVRVYALAMDLVWERWFLFPEVARTLARRTCRPEKKQGLRVVFFDLLFHSGEPVVR